MWSTEATLRLMKDFHTNPCLWDVSSKEYKDRDKRDAALNYLAGKNKVPVTEVEKKLHTLRNQFRREHKKISRSRRSGSGTSIKKCAWFGYEPLMFLLPSMECRDSKRTDRKGKTLDDNNESIVGDANCDIENIEPDITSNPTSKKAKRTSTPSHIQNAIKSLQSIKQDVQKDAEDEHAQFGRYVACTLRKLPVLEALQSQSEIFTLLLAKRTKYEARKQRYDAVYSPAPPPSNIQNESPSLVGKQKRNDPFNEVDYDDYLAAGPSNIYGEKQSQESLAAKSGRLDVEEPSSVIRKNRRKELMNTAGPSKISGGRWSNKTFTVTSRENEVRRQRNDPVYSPHLSTAPVYSSLLSTYPSDIYNDQPPVYSPPLSSAYPSDISNEEPPSLVGKESRKEVHYTDYSSVGPFKICGDKQFDESVAVKIHRLDVDIEEPSSLVVKNRRKELLNTAAPSTTHRSELKAKNNVYSSGLSTVSPDIFAEDMFEEFIEEPIKTHTDPAIQNKSIRIIYVPSSNLPPR